jgi:hypothetical protein
MAFTAEVAEVAEDRYWLSSAASGSVERLSNSEEEQ